MSSLNDFYNATRAALLVGGKILKQGFRRSGPVSYKTKVSPVTKIDLASERAIVKLIHRRFPDHNFLGEESTYLKTIKKSGRASSDYRWIIDPLDGTVNYIHGIPIACVSVGLEYRGQILTGGVYDPFRGELFM